MKEELDENQFIQCIKKFPGCADLTNDEIKAYFESVDTDHGGSVSWEEMSYALQGKNRDLDVNGLIVELASLHKVPTENDYKHILFDIFKDEDHDEAENFFGYYGADDYRFGTTSDEDIMLLIDLSEHNKRPKDMLMYLAEYFK